MGGKSSKPRFNPLKHSYQYDMIVLGGGSGGMACAREAAKLGAKVAICEFVTPTPRGTQWGLGGTCVNVGCVPKRLFHQASLVKDYIGDGPLFGWKVADASNINWVSLVEGVQDLISSLNFSYRVVLANEKITLFKGLATFKNEHEIKVTYENGANETISGQCIVIAVGGRPKYLKIPGGSAKDNFCITSDDIFSLPYPPGKTVCIGAGYIGVECAGFLAAFGYDVTLMARTVVLREFDRDVVNLITQNMIGRTVGVLKGVQPKEIRLVKEGTPPSLKVLYQFNEHGGIAEMDCNTVLLAIGRKPCTKELELKNVPGIKVDEEGYIITDKYECTNVSNIFAIGDCAKGRPQLTPPAIKAGQYLARRIYDKKFSQSIDYQNIPTTIFTPIEYGCCGMSEEEAKDTYGSRNVDVYPKSTIPLEFSLNKRDSEAVYAKLVCLKGKRGKEKVIGFHYLGPNAGDITVGFSMAVKRQCLKKEFDDLIPIHPTCAEVFADMKINKRMSRSYRVTNC